MNMRELKSDVAKLTEKSFGFYVTWTNPSNMAWVRRVEIVSGSHTRGSVDKADIQLLVDLGFNMKQGVLVKEYR